MNLTPRELEIKNKLYSQYKVNRKEFIRDYGANAEQVMVGRAIKLAKQMAEKEQKEKIKEMIKQTLKGGVMLSEGTSKEDFKDKIKKLIKQVLSKTPEIENTAEVDIDSTNVISLDNARFPVLAKFPLLHKIIVTVLTDQYDLFLKEIEWVAPRPTTFRIVLGNDQVFYLIYTDRTWIGKVEGKKYYLLNLSEEQNFIESIARILSYGAKSEPVDTTSTPPLGDEPAPEEPANEEPADEEPIEEPKL